MKNLIELKQGVWVRDRLWYLEFPDQWSIEVFSHKDSSVLEEPEITGKINNPVGTDRLASMVKPGMKILIICDDISRPTRTDQLLPVLINLLEESGVEKRCISILIASGTHGSITRKEILLKLGKNVAEGYKIFTHNCRKRGTYLGRTALGTPVYVNRQISIHDLVIGLGGIYPHNTAGFSGGAKLILGVSSIRTILHFHMKREGATTGGNTENEFRRDLLDAARLAGMNFIVNSMINMDREITQVVAGDVDAAFNQGVEWARKNYGVPKPDAGNFDLVIADTYPFDASYAFTRKGWWPVRNLSRESHKLIISSMHKGKGGHLVYPIPNDRRINKFGRLYYELISFGWRHFISTSLTTRFNKIIGIVGAGRSSLKRAPDSGGQYKPMEADIPGRDVSILHNASGKEKESLKKLPNNLFDNPRQYIRYLTEIYGDKPLRVALYRASSLTFPARDSLNS